MKLDTVHHFVHAYRVAPWRVQRQWIGAFLLSVVGLAMVAALYLDVTAQAGIAGREIQRLAADTSAVQQESADLQTQLAALTSASVMEERALDMGYRPVEPEQVEYIIVPGYSHPEPDILAKLPQPDLNSPSVPSEYTQSLLDWLDQQLQSIGEAK